MLQPLMMNLDYAKGPVVVVDTPATLDVGIAYSAPGYLLHYEAPFEEMSYSAPGSLLEYDSPMR